MDARELADEVLFPTANEIDASATLPRERLDRLAADGWYGLAAPTEAGGMGLSLPDAWEVIAAFAGGCLTTTLVWLQHHGVVATIANGPNADLCDEVLPALARGESRATVAFAGLLPQPGLRARRDGGRWIVDGTAPWVTGWGLADRLMLSARTPEDDVVWLLADAVDSEQVQVTRHRLLALDASSTVTVRIDGLSIDEDREAGCFPWAAWPARDLAGLRTNGSLAIGVAERAARLLGPTALDDELAAVVAGLDAASPEELPAARAAASALAVRLATALVAERGSRAIIRGNDAERLLREATVLLVFASRPAIRSSLLAELGAA